MAKIKFNLPDKKTYEKQRRIASTGAYGGSSKDENSRKYANSKTVAMEITKNAQFAGSGASVTFTQPMFFSPLHTPQNWQIASKRREQYQWCRFYYDNEPRVAAGVDFYAQFPLNGFKLECPDRKVLELYEQLVEDLDLEEWLRAISLEYYMLGDVFPFLEIDSPETRGEVKLEEGESSTHVDGTFKSIRVMNPDNIEVESNVLADEPMITLVPDEELKMIVQRQHPKHIYDKLPDAVKQAVATGRPIKLSNRCVSHIKHNASGYMTYGSPMLRRLFTILAYKTKLMTANWIVAERLILPIRVVKIGDKDRPANEDDISDVVNQLAAVTNDPNLTIVTHHAFEYEWYGATGKIHNITQELEQIGKEILDGLMLNEALLNGEMSGYSSAAVGVETLLRRLESWRNKLKKWVEKRIFEPVAMMQGIIDEKKSERIGKTVYLYPRIKWNELNLRDKTQMAQFYAQLHDKGKISQQTLLEFVNLDYDTEIERMREEQVVASASGMLQPGGMPGGMPGGEMPGMMGGGMGGAPGEEGAAGPAIPGLGGGEMGGGGGDMGGGMGAAAGAAPPKKVMKRGKGKQQEEPEAPPPQMLKLTKLEGKMLNALNAMKVPFKLFGQYTVNIPGQEQPFVIDFAYPEIGVGIETDGNIWHERNDLKARDKMRDQKLADVGWRILRFDEDAVEDHMPVIQDIIYKNIVEASKRMKKAAEDQKELRKIASTITASEGMDTKDELFYNIEDFEQEGLGYAVVLGE